MTTEPVKPPEKYANAQKVQTFDFHLTPAKEGDWLAECGRCGFQFNAMHQTDGTNDYDCPQCESEALGDKCDALVKRVDAWAEHGVEHFCEMVLICLKLLVRMALVVGGLAAVFLFQTAWALFLSAGISIFVIIWSVRDLRRANKV